MGASQRVISNDPPAGANRLRDGWGREAANWLLPLYVMLITAGYFVFRSDAAMVKGNRLSGDRALFAAVNTATLTGLQVSVGTDQMLAFGRIAAFAITFLAAFLTLLIGSTAVVRIVKLRYSDTTIALWALASCTLATLLGLFLLRGDDRTTFQAAFLGLSAFANSGLHFGPLPDASSAATQLLLLPLSVLGGLGLPVLMELADRLLGRRPHLSFYSRTVLAMTGGIYLLGTALFFWILHASAPAGAEPAWRDSLAIASTMTLDARTTGLGWSFATALPRAMQWLLILLMLLGASPASTGAGLKTTTLAELFRGARRALRGEPAGRPFGIALAWTALFLATLFAALLALLSLAPQVPADRMLFDLSSALSNSGLSFDVLSLVGTPLYILAAAMFVGRFGSLLILWWMADTCPDGAELPVG